MLGKPKSQREVRSVLGVRLLGKQDKKEMSDEWKLSHILQNESFRQISKSPPFIGSDRSLVQESTTLGQEWESGEIGGRGGRASCIERA